MLHTQKVSPTNDKKQRMIHKLAVHGFVAFCYSLEFNPYNPHSKNKTLNGSRAKHRIGVRRYSVAPHSTAEFLRDEQTKTCLFQTSGTCKSGYHRITSRNTAWRLTRRSASTGADQVLTANKRR
jgi:hypothetical protein